MNTDLLIVIVLCLLILPIYFKTKSFFSIRGLLLFILGFSALSLRIFLFKKYPPLALLNENTLFLSFAISFIPLLILITYVLIINRNFFKDKYNYLFRLIFPYLLFGALQQLFFLTVVTDSLYYLTFNYRFTLVLSIIFFFIFHLSWKREMRKYWIFLIGFEIINILVYLRLGNILPQMLVHGIAGSVLYTAFYKDDLLKQRLC